MRYFKEVLLAGVLCTAAACNDDPTGPTRTEFIYQGVTLRGRITDGPAPQSYRVFLSAYNKSSAALSLTIAGPCLMKPRLYRNGRLAFDGIAAFPLCPNDVYHFTIQAGDSLPDVWGSLIGAALLGDSLPGGRYQVVAALRPEGTGGAVHELAVGSVDF